MQEKKITLPMAIIAQLETEIYDFLRQPIPHYEKWKLNENIVRLETFTKPYFKTRQEAYKELSEPNGKGERFIAEFKANGLDWVPNPKYKEYLDTIEPIEKEEREVTLRTIPSFILKKLSDASFYPALYRYLIEDEEQQTAAKQ